MRVEFEAMAEKGKLKSMLGGDLNRERRVLFERQKRFDEHRKLLKTTTEVNRKKRGLFGPSTLGMKKYTEEV